MEQATEHPGTGGRDGALRAVAALFAEGAPKTGGVVKIYLRNFANFNDTFGYRQGEELLRQVTGYFEQTMNGAQVCRMGVSFLLLLPGADAARCAAVAEHAAERFAKSWPVGAVECLIGVDVAVVRYPAFAAAADELMRNLDLATAKGKVEEEGANPVVIFDEKLRERLYRHTVIARLLGSAVAAGSLELRYRPTFDFLAGQYTRVECQARLPTVEFGPILSGEFTPIAEESGIILAVNRYILRRACELIHLLLAEGCLFETVSVEISPVTLAHQGFLRQVANLMEEYAVPRKKLALEFRESPLSERAVRPAIEGLRAMGVEVEWSGGEFGFASLKDLLTLPLDVLRLRRLFLWQLETNPRSDPVIEALVQMSAKLGVKLIAEGVETEKQNALLNRYSFPYRQGHFYSHSLDFSRLRELLPVVEGWN